MYYTKEIEKVLQEFNSQAEGLTSSERERRLSVDGKNVVQSNKQSRIWEILKDQLFNLLVLVLVAAAFLSFITDHVADGIVILLVIVINTIVGFAQEFRAERAMESLKKLLVKKSKIMVEGKLVEVDSESIVRGDVVILEEGDIIPADGRIIKATLLKTNESALTGESLPVDKISGTLESNLGTADQKNMVFSGTICSSGRAEYIVTATGSDTEVGQIATDLEQIKEGESQFNKITGRLTQQMGGIALFGAVLILVIGYFVHRYEFTEIFLFSLASLVSSIPEGLPAILTIVLAIGSFRMSRRKAIVRRLSSTETLASVNVICTDKTGTLTENNLKVETLILNDSNLTELNLDSDFSDESNQYLKWSLITAFYGNSAKIASETNGTAIGDPTEIAMKTFAFDKVFKAETQILEDFPFSSDRKFRGTKIKINSEEIFLIAGAPEKLIELSNSSPEQVKLMNEKISGLGTKALRVIALAKASAQSDLDKLAGIEIVGFVAMRDPIRQGVTQAVKDSHAAGIRVVMMTGDHIETAKAIAIDCGIINQSDSAMSEKDLAQFGEDEFANVVRNINVFARLSPSTKLRILQVLQNQGNIVAMTGDGVNDAPALKQADVGISMGLNGTETARESSDIVLADDNFSTIINAVSEGRLVFQNIRRASAFLITTNVAEQVTILVTLILGLPLPLLAGQILWLNLVTDGVNDFALAAEKSHGKELQQKPRHKNENILNWQIVRLVISFSVTMAILTFTLFSQGLAISTEYARTEAFLVMSFTQLFSALNFRSFTQSLFTIGVFSNKFVVVGVAISGLLTFLAVTIPFLRDFLSFETVSVERIMFIFLLSSLVFIFGEFTKKLYRNNS